MASLVLASKRAVKSGAEMWHVYLQENGAKVAESEFYFALDRVQKAVRYMFLLRKRSGAIIPKAVYNKIMADYQASKPHVEPQESAPQAESEPQPTAQAVGEVEQAKFFMQFQQMKAKHPEAVLLFRVKGDYCTFGEDCEVVEAICGASSFPHTALDTWLPKLVRAGKRVAICDDITAPQAKSESAPKKKATRKSAKGESK